MNVKGIQISRDAEMDLCDGRDFYESQERGVGEYFWDSLISDIESLLVYAGIHRKEYGYYRMLSRRFPYSIYYDVVEEVAYVIAVLPMRRDPAWYKEKMSKRNYTSGVQEYPIQDA
ncbi:MAG TPA: type II toxin-antitoxin system RelE/ParE family toxin [Gammaproteobacteria bacterium]|nr:type II toxin-antitoxin system RelE/ParE family toxin [Gammaproteobacteria bacterium]